MHGIHGWGGSMEFTMLPGNLIFLALWSLTSASPIPNMIGNNVGALLVNSQHQADNTGNNQGNVAHGNSNLNSLASNIVDENSFSLINAVGNLDDAIITA